MWWVMIGASSRTRWLLHAVWGFGWTAGYAALTLIPLGVQGYRWWAPIIGFALLAGLAVGALAAWMDRRVVASYAAVLDGLTADQRGQVTRIWRRGPVPTDPMVLTAALRLHDLSESYRRGNQSRRKTGVVLIVIATVLLVVSTFGTDRHVPGTALGFLAIGAFLVAAPTATALRARRLQPRLAQLRAAAQSDPVVAAAVAQPVASAAPLTRGQRLRWVVAVLALVGVCVGALEIAIAVSPHRVGCRAVNAVVTEVYRGRDDLLAADAVGPAGPSLARYQEWSDSLRRMAADGDSDPDAGLYLHRIAVFAAQIVGVVERARQPDQAGSATALAESQHTYFVLIKALVDEEGYAQEHCRR